MPPKQRSRAYRLEQKKKHRKGPKPPESQMGRSKNAYQQNKRNAERAALRQGDWGWL